MPNTDRLTTGNFYETDFWSAQCMQCTSRFTTKTLNDSWQFVELFKFSWFTGDILLSQLVSISVSLFIFSMCSCCYRPSGVIRSCPLRVLFSARCSRKLSTACSHHLSPVWTMQCAAVVASTPCRDSLPSERYRMLIDVEEYYKKRSL